MTYSADWSDSTPVDHTKLNEVAAGMRAIRLAQSERLKAIFYGFISGETQTDEGVKNLPFRVQASDPGATADKIKLYAKDVSAKAALFIEDEDANVWQFSQRAGDLLSTFSTVVPAGYTDITSTYNNKMMRYSTGAVETTGGTDTHTHGGTTGSTVLAEANLPAHTHTVSLPTVNNNSGAGGNNVAVESPQNSNDTISMTTSSIGSGTGHTHTIASADNIPAYFTARLLKRA